MPHYFCNILSATSPDNFPLSRSLALFTTTTLSLYSPGALLANRNLIFTSTTTVRITDPAVPNIMYSPKSAPPSPCQQDTNMMLKMMMTIMRMSA